MKILIVHEIDWIKKVPFEPHHLAEIFSTKGHEVFVIDCAESDLKNIVTGFRTSIISKYNRIYKNASITLIRPSSLLVKGANRLTHFLTCKNVIKKTVIENKIDIILLYSVATSGVQTIKVGKEMKIPVVFRALDTAHRLVKIPIVRQLAKKFEKEVITNALKVLATTPNLAAYTREMGAKDENVEYFPLGINAQIFKPMVKNIQLAQKLGITEHDKVVVFIGTIYEFAGLDKIISNFEFLKRSLKNIKLLIIGGGPFFNTIKSLVSKKKIESDVILTGFKPQSDLPKYISLADICINPFEVNETTDRVIPTKILEYLVCGKPVLSTPLKGTTELLPNDDFGINYSSCEKFLETLLNLLKNTEKLEKLGNAGFEYTKNHHDWDILSDKLIKKFESLISH